MRRQDEPDAAIDQRRLNETRRPRIGERARCPVSRAADFTGGPWTAGHVGAEYDVVVSKISTGADAAAAAAA
jgi:hypothetical protein